MTFLVRVYIRVYTRVYMWCEKIYA